MGEIAKIFTVSVGPHMMVLFLLGALSLFLKRLQLFPMVAMGGRRMRRNLFKRPMNFGIDDPSPEAKNMVLSTTSGG